MYAARMKKGVDPDDLFATRSTVMDEEEIKEYLSNHRLGMITAFNFIDFD